MTVQSIARVASHLVRPLPASHVLGRERTRSVLVLAAALIIAVTLALHRESHGNTVAALGMLAVVSGTWLLSIRPRLPRRAQQGRWTRDRRRDHGAKSYEISVIRRDDALVPVSLTTTPIVVDSEIVGVHGVAKDISERVALEESLTHQAHHDPLTGLANRSLLGDRLRQALAACARDDVPVALMVLDLDGFKAVNDTLGHAAGDAILVEVADRLQSCVRITDTVARMGGDEFAVVLGGANEDRAREVADRIEDALALHLNVDGRAVEITASVGLAVGDASSVPDALLHQADSAMYAAKHAPETNPAVFHADVPSTAACRHDGLTEAGA